MDWHLQQIELKNFKFFKERFEFPVDKKNILLYGENGSGKSSIVWGLYTLMESHLKPVADVHKYFDPANGQHLRNRYSSYSDDSYVKTVFVPEQQGVPSKTYEVSDQQITTQNAGDDFMNFTAASFDMFNYRMLSDLIYQSNSREIDMFGAFEKDIFKYLYLSRPYTDVCGNPPSKGGDTAEEWWSYIKSVRLPQTKRSQVNKGTAEYTNFTTLLKDFHDEIETVLMRVEHSANDMLHADLNLPKVTIEINITDIPFNLVKPDRRKSRDGKVHNPVISVKAKVEDDKVPGWSTKVDHLATFFNEAKLTCIAVAIRLAISDYKLISSGNVAPVLCLDDLLLSLDMSARIPIIKLLLKKANDRQLMVFTHDRAFYETMRMLIQEARKEGVWHFYEMFEHKKRNVGDCPKPFFRVQKDYRDKAQACFEECDYPASANYLRKYCEQQLKRLLPSNMLTRFKSNGEAENEDLNGLIAKMESKFCPLYDIALANMPSLSVYRKRLMNPLSHDDTHTPVYKSEILSAVAEIDKLKTIADSKKKICDGNGSHNDEFIMYVVNGTTNERVDFKVMEVWYSVEVGGRRYYKDVKIEVTSTTTTNVVLQVYDSLRSVFGIVCSGLGLNTPATPPPAMETTIKNKFSGVALTAI